MNSVKRLAVVSLVLLVGLLTLVSPVSAQTEEPPQNNSPVIFGGSYELTSGSTVDTLVIFGGNAVLQPGSTVDGDIVLFGGSLEASGTVTGDVTSLGGQLRITDTAVIEGNLNTLGGSQAIAPNAVIKGGESVGVAGLPSGLTEGVITGDSTVRSHSAASILWFTLTALMAAIFAVIIAALLPKPMDRVAKTIETQPIVSGAVGLLTLIIAPALCLVLIITLILIPVAALGLVALGLAMFYGWASLGLLLGKKMSDLFKGEWPLAVQAGIGTLILSLVFNFCLLVMGWVWVLCCLVVPLLLVAAMVSLGGVLASKFGMRVYSPVAPGGTTPINPHSGPATGGPGAPVPPSYNPPAGPYMPVSTPPQVVEPLPPAWNAEPPTQPAGEPPTSAFPEPPHENN